MSWFGATRETCLLGRIYGFLLENNVEIRVVERNVGLRCLWLQLVEMLTVVVEFRASSKVFRDFHAKGYFTEGVWDRSQIVHFETHHRFFLSLNPSRWECEAFPKRWNVVSSSAPNRIFVLRIFLDLESKNQEAQNIKKPQKEKRKKEKKKKRKKKKLGSWKEFKKKKNQEAWKNTLKKIFL